MPQQDTLVQWYAMSATYRSELKIKEYLDGKQVESFIPLVTGFRVINRRRVKTQVPAVSNLIFVHSSKKRIDDLKISQPRLQYKMMPDGLSRRYVTIPDAEMQNFINACTLAKEKKNFLDPSTIDFDALNIKSGDKVRICCDNGSVVEGTLVAVQGRRKKKVVIGAAQLMYVTLDQDSANYTIEKL